MSSSLVWLPPKKYDSIKSLWQDQYIWSALPVDNSLPLDKTSFIDINEDEAKAARSRSNTLRSRASTGCIRHVQGGEQAKEFTAEGEAGEEEEEEEEGIAQPEKETRTNHLRSRGHRHAASTTALRPSTLSYNRLRSFHLPARIQTNNAPEKTTAVPEAEVKGSSVETGYVATSPLQEIIVIEEQPYATRDLSPEPVIRRTQSSVAVPATQEEPAIAKPCSDVVAKAQEVTPTDQPKQRPSTTRRISPKSPRESQPPGIRTVDRDGRRPLPSESPKRKSSGRTSHPKQTSLRLSLNLEVEVQLKMSLHGDVMLTLLN